MRLKSDCVYGRCKMVNLCKGSHCVGAGLDADGYKIDGFGNIIENVETTTRLCPDCGRDVSGPTHATYCPVSRPDREATE